MASITSVISGVQKLLNSLTWEKILQLVVFLLVVGSAWATFENRQSIYNFVNRKKIAHAPVYKISSTTAKELTSSVDRSSLIVGIQVLIVDFQKNIRTVVYTYTDDKSLFDLYLNFSQSNVTQDIPLFTNDVSNNKRIVDLINGEFVCGEYTDSPGARYLPESKTYIRALCSNGIPPFYGKFTGIVTVYLKQMPTDDEVTQLRSLTTKWSALIFENDVK